MNFDMHDLSSTKFLVHQKTDQYAVVGVMGFFHSRLIVFLYSVILSTQNLGALNIRLFFVYSVLLTWIILILFFNKLDFFVFLF